MNLLNDRPLISGLVFGLLVGILFGWLVIGWGVWPVTWTDANPELLREDHRTEYVQMVADLYSYTLDQKAAVDRRSEWSGSEQYICDLANQEADGLKKQSLYNLAQAVSPGVVCADNAGPVASEDKEEGQSLYSKIGLLCGAALLAVLIVGGVFFFLARRRPTTEYFEEEVPEEKVADVPTVAAQSGRTIPLAQFPTEYNLGHDTYDDSFSIETATGEFLGECGVGISETIGVGDPKKITAFEVWLFDKNDIRTVTKVLMSHHAYHDDALRAKLAPKGEAVLAEPGGTVVLETASLIINAHVVEMEYGMGELAPESYFDRLVVELAAWAKETEELAVELPEIEDEFAIE